MRVIPHSRLGHHGAAGQDHGGECHQLAPVGENCRHSGSVNLGHGDLLCPIRARVLASERSRSIYADVSRSSGCSRYLCPYLINPMIFGMSRSRTRQHAGPPARRRTHRGPAHHKQPTPLTDHEKVRKSSSLVAAVINDLAGNGCFPVGCSVGTCLLRVEEPVTSLSLSSGRCLTPVLLEHPQSQSPDSRGFAGEVAPSRGVGSASEVSRAERMR